MEETSLERKNKLFILSIVIYVLSGLIFIRLFILQIIQREKYYQQSEENRTQIITIPAYRSVVYDCTEENKLAYNRRSLAIVCIPANLPRDAVEKETALSNVSALLDIPISEISNMIAEQALDKYTSVVLKYDIDPDELVRFAEHSELYPGMYWDNRPRRIYPLMEKASQLIGYTGIIDRAELERLRNEQEYHSGSILGKMGIERQYDERIRGHEGVLERVVDARGRVLSQTIRRDAIPGNPLVLTIHKELQEMAYDLFQGRIGAVVVSKPATGEILALVSSPGFDPNVFTDRFSEEAFFLLKQNIDKPFLNRAIQGTYPPASIFKLVTAAAALSGGWDPNKIINCPGFLKIGNRVFKDWNTHGRVNFTGAIAHSCDVYFYTAGLATGRDRIVQFAKDFGINQRTQIDLPNETYGLVPEIDWFKRAHNRPWSQGDTANISIGQGDLLATPIGLNVMTMAIANGGIVYKPFVLKKVLSILDRSEIWVKQPEILRKINLTPDQFALIQKAMHEVTQPGGTAGWLTYLTDVPFAAKTGTGQAGGELEDHAWFTCYGPYGYTDINDVICITVVVEHGGSGSGAAGPIAVQLLQHYFHNIHPMDFGRRQ